MNKYHARKCEYGGMKFDSKKEMRRWIELCQYERAGVIKDLQRQVAFEIIPRQDDEKGRCIERAAKYVADFVYWTKNGTKWKMVVEDTKSPATRTAEYILKRKLMLKVHGIQINEI